MAETTPGPQTPGPEAPVTDPSIPSTEQALGSLAAYMAAFAALPEDALRFPKPQRDPKEIINYPHASKWGWAALNGLTPMYGKFLWPTSRQDRAHMQKMYDTKNHLGHLTATLAVAEQGLYKILPGSEKSELRKNDSLKHLTRSERKSIEREEKNYQRAAKQAQHALHVLKHSGEPEKH